MDCKDFMRLIPAFLNKELEYDELKRFCKHAMECDDCKEELTIQFLVAEGINHLEAGDAFDLNKELQNRMKESEQMLHGYEGRHKKASILQLLGAVCVLVSVVLIFVL